MRTLLALILLGLTPIASAATMPAPALDVPVQVMAVIDVPSYTRQSATWMKAMARLNQPWPSLTDYHALVAKLIARPGPLAGIDDDRGMHVLWLNPVRFPSPLLVVPVRDLKALRSSVAGSDLTVTPLAKGWAVVGQAAALAEAGPLPNRLAMATPPGATLEAVVYLTSVRAVFGLALDGWIQMLATTTPPASTTAPAQPAAAGRPPALDPAAMQLGLKQLAALLKQSERLTVDLQVRPDDRLDVQLALQVETGSSLDHVARAQQPSEFATLAKLPQNDWSWLFAGTLRFDLLNEMLDSFGIQTTEPQRALISEMQAQATGDLAFAGQLTQPGDKHEVVGLTAVKDARRMTEIYEKSADLFATLLTPFARELKYKQVALPSAQYDGLTLGMQRQEYDLPSPNPKLKTRLHLKRQVCHAGFDGWVATVTSDSPTLARMHALVDSARHGQGTLTLDDDQQSLVAEARAEHDSGWFSVHWNAGTSTLPARLAVLLGFAPQTLRLHAIY